jgi:hypothetical protein
MVQACLGRRQEPVSKITTAKRAGSVAQAVECLPSECEALSSNLIPPKKPKKASTSGSLL